MSRHLTPIRLLLIWLSAAAICSAQKQNNVWYFGSHTGINFNTFPPTPVTRSPLVTPEGTASTCDPTTGAVLFFTDGVTVWNRNNGVMPNGTNLHGGLSSTQSALIVPLPGSSTTYYIFTTAQLEGGGFQTNGLQYSVVDMTRDGGLGDVVTKNVPVLAPSAEKIAAVQNCDGQGIWILGIAWATNELHAYLLTSAGLSTAPARSPLGFQISLFTVQGCMQASPNGAHVAIATATGDRNSRIDLYDFDRTTGTLSNHIPVDTASYGHFGVCFSPDNSRIYFASTADITAHAPDTLWQCDISSGDEASIVASKTYINTPVPGNHKGSMQIGPDGIVYVAEVGNELGMILAPNKPGIACRYVPGGFSVDPDYLTIGINTYLYPRTGSSFGIAVSPDTTICAGSPALLSASGGAYYRWYPTDGLDCANCPRPLARPAKTTTYYVSIIAESGCLRTDSVTVTVLPAPSLHTLDDTVICFGDSIRLATSGASSYTWSPTTGLSCTTCASPTAKPRVTTTYTVIGYNANDCEDMASITVSVNPPTAIGVGSDTAMCAGGEAHLHASGAEQFRWEPTDGLSCSFCSDPVARPKTTTTYFVTGFNSTGCNGFDSVTVTIASPPDLDAGPTASICLGEAVQLHASGATSFSWSPADELSCADCPDPVARPTTTTTYTVTGIDSIGCAATDTVSVIVGTSISALVTGQTSICPGDSAQLHASGGNTFSWSPSTGLSCADCPDPVARPTTTTTYSVTVTGSGNCVGTDSASITVSVLDKPVISIDGITEICTGSSTNLVASGGTAYRWSPQNGLSCADCPDPIASPLSTTTYSVVVASPDGCVDSASTTVVVHTPPALDLGGDRSICAGAPEQLHATGADSYLWSPSTGLSCVDCPDPIATPSSTTTYHITGLDTFGCSASDSITITVLPSFSVDAGPDTTICPDGVATLSAPVGDYSYSWSLVDGLSCPTCRTTEARPTATTDYMLTATDADGCSASDVVRVEIDTASHTVHAHIGRDYHISPGSVADVVVQLDDPIPGAQDLDISLRYDPSVVRLREARQVGTIASSWAIENENSDVQRGIYTARLHGPDGTGLVAGTLLHLIFGGYVGAVDTSEIELLIELPDVECLAARSTPGLVRIDSICGLSLRLIAVNAENYALDGNRPNPFNPTTEIAFSIGLDGPTRLEIFDDAGRNVATLIDEHLEAGRYIVTWDATEYPSGMYYYRLTSGEWSRSGVMTLKK